MICEKPTKKYPQGRTGTPAGYQAHRYIKEDPCDACRDGHTAYNQDWDITDKGRFNQRKVWLKKQYGITQEDYRALLDEQGYACAICGTSVLDLDKRLAVDHNHGCCPGKTSCGDCVRGLLCDLCNRGLGYFKDSIEMLGAAQQYLKEHNE